ncbi:hypothetical protein ABT063_16510 [Streptomyces sp. NPDC002838]|uniref:hypothetical protein n=1 Tax=Streptomyces sp. NPDC002838 TaxID=3154436 RepID=UPI0033298BFE
MLDDPEFLLAAERAAGAEAPAGIEPGRLDTTAFRVADGEPLAELDGPFRPLTSPEPHRRVTGLYVIEDSAPFGWSAYASSGL